MRIIVLTMFLYSISLSNNFCNAVKNHDFKKAESLLKNNVCIDIKDSDGLSALFNAAANGDTLACDFLLKHGADVEDRNSNEKTPLMAACERGQQSTVRLLIGKGALINSKTGSGYTPLIYALKSGANFELIKLLLDNNADTSGGVKEDGYRSNNSFTPLFFAAQSPDSNVFLHFFKNQAVSNTQLNNGFTPLMAAARKGARHNLLWLINNGADVNSLDKDSCSALMHACESATDSVIIECLLSHGADPNQRKKYEHMTPLMVASYMYNESFIRVLVKYNADVSAINDLGESALFLALKNNRYPNALILLNNGASFNLITKDSMSIGNLLSYCDKDITIKAIKSGFDCNKIYSTSRSYSKSDYLLCHAAASGDDDIIEVALKYGANSKLTNRDGNTPVQLSFIHDKWMAFKRLIQGNAFIDSAGLNKYLLWTVNTKDSSSSDIAAILLQKGADPNCRDNKTGETSLIRASSNGDWQLIKRLLKAGADPLLRDRSGNSALHKCAGTESDTCASLLIGKGADIRAIDAYGNTPAIAALLARDTIVASKLFSKGAAAVMTEELYEKAFGHDGDFAMAQYVVAHFPKLRKNKALFYACDYGDLKIVQLLLDNGANVNARNENGLTPLMRSYGYMGSPEVCRLLIDRGAKTDATDYNGRSVDWYMNQTFEDGE